MQRNALQRAAQIAAIGFALVMTGCASPTAPRPQASYALVARGSLESNIHVYRSAHYTLYTTLADLERVAPIIDTLEVAYGSYETATGIHARPDAPRMNAYVFQHRDEWEAFTRYKTGPAAAVYLRLHKGGYSFGDVCAVVDQGDRDTRAILAHEGFHLFLTTRFTARPPPFIEEGMATSFESILDANGVAQPTRADGSIGDAARRISLDVRGHSLRQLLGMHAGNAIASSPAEVEAFYAHALTFVQFLRRGDAGRWRAGFDRMLADAAAGRLSSADLSGTAALVERYLGSSLEAIEPSYRAFVAREAAEVQP